MTAKKLAAFRMLISLVVIIIVSIIREIRKDGFQATDLFAFLSSEQFKNEIGPAVNELPKMIGEFKEFDGNAGFEIARIAVDVGETVYNEIKQG